MASISLIISVEELKKFGEEMFDDPDRPWRQTFLHFMAEHPGATFYHASAGEGVIFVYSRTDKGLWVSARGAAYGHCRREVDGA